MSEGIRRRKLRVLILSLGGERRLVLERAFQQCGSHNDNENATIEVDFAPGIPSRELRNRESFFRHCHTAGLLPLAEWNALEAAFAKPCLDKATGSTNHTTLWDCLSEVPIQPNRRGSDCDVALHYSVELWRKAKTVNRGRAVLACALAHLTALRRLVTEDFDVLLEDNVRFPMETVIDRMWDCIYQHRTDQPTQNEPCHMRYFGWLGSVPNLQWIYTSHMPKYDHLSTSITVPCPTPQDIDADLAADASHLLSNGITNDETDDENEAVQTCETTTAKVARTKKTASVKDLTKPGGNPVWGTYAYWISREAYEAILRTLQNDVGTLLWKSKRMRYYHVKPIDKIVPRVIRSTFGTNAAVQISRRPAFFRAPMLTSQIHTQWDPEFCKSTTYQLQQSGLTWSDLSITATEQQIVQFAMTNGEWLTPAEWKLQHEGPDSVDTTTLTHG